MNQYTVEVVEIVARNKRVTLSAPDVLFAREGAIEVLQGSREGEIEDAGEVVIDRITTHRRGCPQEPFSS